MTKQIQIKTKYVGLALSEVEALHKLKDVDAAIELILRSPFGEANFRVQVENNIKTSVTGEIAYQIAKEHLTTYPDHPIFNYVIGRVPTYKSHFQPNQVTQAEKLAAEQSLLKIFYFGQAPLFNSYVYQTLAYIYRAQRDKPIEAMAWCALAIIHGSDIATKAFLSDTFLPLDSSISSEFLQNHHIKINDSQCVNQKLSECAFLVMILTGVSLPNFKDCIWLKKYSTSKALVLAHGTKDAFEELEKNNKDIHRIIKLVLNTDRSIFQEFFLYGLNNHIFSDRICIKLLNIFLEKATEQDLKDKVNYSLFLYYAYQKNDNARIHFHSLSPSFKGFQTSDFIRFTPEDQSTASYGIFKQLMSNRHFDEAICFLKNVTDCNDYDSDLFNFFDEYCGFKEDYDLFKLKKDIINHIIQDGQNVLPEVWMQASLNYEIINRPEVALYHAFLSVFPPIEAYLAPRPEIGRTMLDNIRDRLQKTETIRVQWLKKLQEFKEKLITPLPNNIYSQEDYKELYGLIFTIISKMKIDTSLAGMVTRLTTIMDEMKSIIENLSHALPMNPLVQPSAPPEIETPRVRR
ncbi:MAG: hypothetical protein A3F11_00940 [Gammaproteobacteria bacterium RIFCSPHIGHO2_12_FULL_37_14]|nr:MAG: hypothetical protein A3F11_00940 [Gammaproteobacteria bacterium RIFCSPHIGHO2_12_FULL_37_14]